MLSIPTHSAVFASPPAPAAISQDRLAELFLVQSIHSQTSEIVRYSERIPDQQPKWKSNHEHLVSEHCNHYNTFIISCDEQIQKRISMIGTRMLSLPLEKVCDSEISSSCSIWLKYCTLVSSATVGLVSIGAHSNENKTVSPCGGPIAQNIMKLT